MSVQAELGAAVPNCRTNPYHQGIIMPKLLLMPSVLGETVGSNETVSQKELERQVTAALVNKILGKAPANTTQIVFQPSTKKSFITSYRTDSGFKIGPRFEYKEYVDILYYIKTRCSMNIAATSLPQSGKGFIRTSENETISLRVSLLPTTSGEAMIIDWNVYTLDTQKNLLALDSQYKAILDTFKLPSMCTIVIGPPRSGKTKLIASLMSTLDPKQNNGYIVFEDETYEVKNCTSLNPCYNSGMVPTQDFFQKVIDTSPTHLAITGTKVCRVMAPFIPIMLERGIHCIIEDVNLEVLEPNSIRHDTRGKFKRNIIELDVQSTKNHISIKKQQV